MRIAYLLKLNIDRYPGVFQKVKSQTQQWIKLGHTVKVFCVCPGNLNTPAISNWSYYFEGSKLQLFKLNLLDLIYLAKQYNEVNHNVLSFDPDVVYVRNTFYQPFIGRLLRKIPSVIEVNTIEKSEYILLAKKSVKYMIVLPYFLLTWKKLLNKSQGICAVSYEIGRLLKNQNPLFRIKIIPNSIQLKEKIVKLKESKLLPQMVFIGTANQPWNGIDILIEIAARTVDKLEFHVIGMINETSVPSNITFHGEMNKEEYSEIIKKSDIGIGTLALDRKGMIEASPLKIREYLSFGLPIIINYIDTAFIQDSPEWILKLPSSKTQLLESTNKIVEFARINKGMRLSFREISNYISSNVLELERLDFIKSVIK